MTISQIAFAYREWSYPWKELDAAIFDAVSRHRAHRDQAAVFAKVALVNRVYRTNLLMVGADVESNLAAHYIRTKIDRVIKPLTKVVEFDRGSVSAVVDVHEEFLLATAEITGRNENSFCAKYLSFHFPQIVPIFDRFAYDKAWNLVGKRLKDVDYSGRLNADYRYHAAATLLLIDELRERGIPRVDLKRLDNVLYSAPRRIG